MPGMSAGPDFSLFTMALFMAVGLVVTVLFTTFLGTLTLPLFFVTTFAMEAFLRLFQRSGFLAVRVALMMFRSLRRNLLRTSLTYVALFVFTFVLTLIYSIVAFLESVQEEKQQDVKVIMTEKFQVPSQMPPRYTSDLVALMKKELPTESQPRSFKDDVMTWGFVGGSLDPVNKTLENSLFMFAMEPHSLLTMMDDLGQKDMPESEYAKFSAAVAELEKDKRNILVGKDKLATMKKEIGEEVKIYSMNYKDIVLECKIVGTFPDGRYNGSAVMRLDYMIAKLDDYKVQKGTAHPLAERCTNLVWVRLPNKQAYEQLAAIVNEPGKFNSPAVKMETASAGIGSFLDAYKDILFAVKYILMPSLALIMALVVSITMTIAIRERRTEMAVLKVLGFPPKSVFWLIFGEGLLIGFLSGLICTWFVYGVVLVLFPGGIKFPIAFFGAFKLNPLILVYGPLLGTVAAAVGTFMPAWNGAKVKASEVFSQVA
jgi:putative ABC transport system permease protein